MESPNDPRSSRSVIAPATVDYSTELTPTHTIATGDANEHARDSQEHQAQPDETASAYLLKWTETEVTKTRVDSIAQLRSSTQDDSNSTRHLLVFRGLPVDHCMALKEDVDIDASFIEALLGRRCYRPSKRIKAGWAHYDYPELVCQSSALDNRHSRGLVGDPPVYLTSGTGDSVIFCRASIWLSEKAQILFLDPVASKLAVSRRPYNAYTTEVLPDDNSISTIMTQFNVNGNTTVLRDEIADLEAMLCDNLQDGCSSREDILELLEDLVINKWSDFFEALNTDLSVNVAETAALFSHTLGCLERNLDVSRQRYRAIRPSIETRLDTRELPETRLQSRVAEWEALLSRLNRRVQLSSYLDSVVASSKAPARKPSAKTEITPGFRKPSGDGHGDRPNYNSRNNGRGSSARFDENQRSLNRVTYLGGILLPFSIVSGILAIGEPFGPGGPQFWIFWAVTVPLVLLTLLIVYADSIRKGEVWIEVAAASGKADFSDNTDGLPDGSVHDTNPDDVEQGLPISTRLAEPISLPLAGDIDTGEPQRMVQKRWGNKSAHDTRPGSAEAYCEEKKRWRKEELGWMGAFATVLQLYKLKAGVPPERLRRG